RESVLLRRLRDRSLRAVLGAAVVLDEGSRRRSRRRHGIRSRDRAFLFDEPLRKHLRLRVPYELSFTRPIGIRDREQYINDCCVGGDIVRDALLPLVTDSTSCEDVQTEQEDWGWFIWFRKGSVRLAIDIFTDDPDAGAFRIHLTSRAKRFLAFE